MRTVHHPHARWFWLIALSIAAALAFALLPQPASAGAVGPVDGSGCGAWVAPVVDVSSYQPGANFTVAAAWGTKGVYVKATEGTWYTSPTYGDQKANASNAGLPVGAYDFARPGDTNPVTEAQYFLSVSGAGVLTLPPMIDVEVTTLSPHDTAVWVAYWVAYVKSVTGKQPLIYMGGYFSAAGDPLVAQSGPLFLPAYGLGYAPVPGLTACNVPSPTSAGAWGAWTGWQFTSVGSIPGIPGNVDVSAFTAGWWDQWTGTGAGYYRAGATGPKVIQIQNLLKSVGLYAGVVDGVYGPGTQIGVAYWQARLGVSPVDGVWGPSTQAATDALFAYLATKPAPTPPKPAPLADHCRTVVLHKGIHGHGKCVKLLQRRLQLRGFPIARDGKYGKDTRTAVIAYKRLNHLPKGPRGLYDGIVARHTWTALLSKVAK